MGEERDLLAAGAGIPIPLQDGLARPDFPNNPTRRFISPNA
jgi:hypothetical protein